MLDEASRPYRNSGRFAYHYSRGKLSGDDIFRSILERGLLPPRLRLLDLGCGQGSLFSWLLAARALYRDGEWPTGWPEPPLPLELRGYELMPKDVSRARCAFGSDHPLVRIRQGDMCEVDLGEADAITILDALHYVSFERQERLLQRIRRALVPGGVFLTRVGDAGAGLPFHLCQWADRAVTFARGHRLPQLYTRSLAQWVGMLQGLGFVVDTAAMNGGKPFANVMMVCRLPADRSDGAAARCERAAATQG